MSCVVEQEPITLLIAILIDEVIDLGYKVCIWSDKRVEDCKDINDMIISGKTKDEVQTIIKNNSYQGNMAKIRFTTWRRRNA